MFLQLAGAGVAASLLRVRAAEEAAATPIFDGKTLEHWKITDFAGHGDVKVEDGQMVLDAGSELSGVNYAGEVPKTNYEISLEAMRLAGDDFFCGLTMPVGAAFVTFVVGGWGGSVVGISSIGGEDASENETTQFRKFDSNKWYALRVRVTDKRLDAWIDNDQTVKLELEGKRLAMRAGEIELSQPFGFATFRTRAVLRKIVLRRLS